MIWQSYDAVMVTGGSTTRDWIGNKVVIDSRLVEVGDIFLALKGEYNDGHDFVNQALERGAAACIVTHIPTGVNPLSPLLFVEDVYKALCVMAEYKRKTSKAKFIAVTGSVGKTSTKEALQIAFSAQGKTFSSRGNYNNFMGVPVNLASLPDDVEYAIFEIGTSAPGEISPLTKMVRPDIAIITSVDAAHLEFFGSVEKIAEAKSEIFEGLQDASIAILNKDNSQFELLNKLAIIKGVKKVVSVGNEGDYQITQYSFDNHGCNLVVNLKGKNIDYRVEVNGLHQAHNTLVALAAVQELEKDPVLSAKAMNQYSEIKGRGKKITVNKLNINYTIIDDSYNSSPTAVKAALKVLSKTNGRKVAVLADMYELGPNSKDFHIGLAKDIESNMIDKVITCGNLMKDLYDQLPENIKIAHFNKVEDMYNNIDQYFCDGDNILVKGSFGTKIRFLVEYLVKDNVDVV